MKKILQIKRPGSLSYIYWEHAMKPVFAFSGTFALLYFGPMLLASGRRSGVRDDEFALHILYFLNKHPEIQFSVCITAVLIYNGFIIYKNYRKKYVVFIASDGQEIEFGLTNLFYREIFFIKSHVKETGVILERRKSDTEGKSQHLKFVKSSNSDLIGEILPDHLLWNKEIKEIGFALKTLKEYNVNVEIKSKYMPSPISAFFKR